MKTKYIFDLINSQGLVIDTKESVSIQFAAKAFKAKWQVSGAKVVQHIEGYCPQIATQTEYKFR